MEARPDARDDDVAPCAIEENVWQGIEDPLMKSPAVRSIVKDGKARVVGAIYDVGTGKWRGYPLKRSMGFSRR